MKIFKTWPVLSQGFRVQQKATVKCLENFSSEKKVERVGLLRLEERRLREYTISAYNLPMSEGRL